MQALAAFEHVLLEGGARTFVSRDAPTLEEELQASFPLSHPHYTANLPHTIPAPAPAHTHTHTAHMG